MSYPKSQLSLAKKLLKKHLKNKTDKTEFFLKNYSVASGATSSSRYTDLVTELNALYTAIKKDCDDNHKPLGARLIVNGPDGTVVWDSRNIYSTLTKENTYANYVGKTINENHNTRISIMKAMNSFWGKGKEIKPAFNANKTCVLESRYCVRFGGKTNHIGSIALSIEEEIPLTAA
jgi:hypothetical protein